MPNEVPFKQATNWHCKIADQRVRRYEYFSVKFNSNIDRCNKTCKCELMFCSKHFPFEDHNCSFDYKAFSKKKYETTVSLGGGSFTKVNII